MRKETRPKGESVPQFATVTVVLTEMTDRVGAGAVRRETKKMTAATVQPLVMRNRVEIEMIAPAVLAMRVKVRRAAVLVKLQTTGPPDRVVMTLTTGQVAAVTETANVNRNLTAQPAMTTVHPEAVTVIRMIVLLETVTAGKSGPLVKNGRVMMKIATGTVTRPAESETRNRKIDRHGRGQQGILTTKSLLRADAAPRPTGGIPIRRNRNPRPRVGAHVNAWMREKGKRLPGAGRKNLVKVGVPRGIRNGRRSVRSGPAVPVMRSVNRNVTGVVMTAATIPTVLSA